MLLLDHELLLAAVLGDSGDMLSVHHDVVAFLMAVHLDPLAYLEDSWRYPGPTVGSISSSRLSTPA